MQKPVNPLPGNAIWKHFKGPGASAHFYHANGFPLGVYGPFLTQLSRKFNLSALEWRATWPGMNKPPQTRDWRIYADDLIAFIEEHCITPIIGIGHSMGATCTVLAAEKRPDLFKALVLIEPAMVSRPAAFIVRFIPEFMMNLFEPAKSTLKKPDYWPSRTAYLHYCKNVKAYRRFNDKAYEAMARHGVTETMPGRFQLAFPKDWEAHNYTMPPNILGNLKRLSIPCVAVRGNPSLFFTDAMWRKWRKSCPGVVFRENTRYGHLLPLENPDACADLIISGLEDLLR